MDSFLALYTQLRPDSLIPLAAGMMVTGVMIVAFFILSDRTERTGVRKRLTLPDIAISVDPKVAAQQRKKEAVLKEKTLKKAQEFYSKTDPHAVARLRMQLIQAGYMDPSAAGFFFAARFALLVAFTILTFLFLTFYATEVSSTKFWGSVLAGGAFGYVAPTLWLSYQGREKQLEYRNGFPDFLDLMIVCSDAGMSMEAAIERISREIETSYPSLSKNLALLSIELRAGRTSDEAMKSLADRIGLDEVRSFATLIQQSRELGTSLSGALRVFSDEMRHKRMSKAEEKAHSLPAKMSVPVTMCILPVVMLVAVIPIIAKFSAGE